MRKKIIIIGNTASMMLNFRSDLIKELLLNNWIVYSFVCDFNEEQLKKLEDAIAFKNVSNMPARVKCAVLGWHTLDEALKKYGPERIVVGVDVRDRKVSIAGWLETSDVDYLTFIHQLEDRGVKYIVCTDISKDGTLTGPSFPLYEEIHANSKINFVVSGGVKDDEDVYEVNKRDYYACIVGKAYYEGRINLKEVIENAG
mgnify:CR=1 FL=1